MENMKLNFYLYCIYYLLQIYYYKNFETFYFYRLYAVLYIMSNNLKYIYIYYDVFIHKFLSIIELINFINCF